MALTLRLIKLRRFWIARQILGLYGIDIPVSVKIDSGFGMPHKGCGTVIAGDTVIGDRVDIFHNVTIGRADVYLPRDQRAWERVVVDDDVVICAGAVVLASDKEVRLRRGSVVAANAVLTTSTGEWEIWGGIPARKIGERPRFDPPAP